MSCFGEICIVSLLIYIVWRRNIDQALHSVFIRRISTPIIGKERLQIKRQTSHKYGCLHVRCGPMFSGKTTWVHCQLTQYADVNRGCQPLLINSTKDDRKSPDNSVSSHASSFKGISDKVATIKVNRLDEVKVDGYDVIGINEAQFFDGMASIVKTWRKQGKQLYISGLDSYANGEPFGEIHLLLHDADTFEKIPALCEICVEQASTPVILSEINPAPFTSKRRGQNNMAVDPGGSDKYYPACRAHRGID
jgi:thymidine kinase